MRRRLKFDWDTAISKTLNFLQPVVVLGAMGGALSMCAFGIKSGIDAGNLVEQFDKIIQDGIEYELHGQTSLKIDDDDIETYFNFGTSAVIVTFDDEEDTTKIWQFSEYKNPRGLERARVAACNLASKFSDAKEDLTDDQVKTLEDEKHWSNAIRPLVCDEKPAIQSATP